MRSLLAQKVPAWHPLAERLMATGDAELIEGNTWGDRYWGVVDGTGENRLDKHLMQRRGALNACAGQGGEASRVSAVYGTRDRRMP
jgi:predicted NAD-dependent protein-ADP-ribosyltransferase YbiA (DUF1768 family)